MAASLKTEQAIFEAARKLTPGQQRDAYLAQACGADAALLDRVQRLLFAYEQSTNFLEPPQGDAF